MSNLMHENLSLLDRMHEGLIVLSERGIEDPEGIKVTFASKPAIKLLKSDKNGLDLTRLKNKNKSPDASAHNTLD